MWSPKDEASLGDGLVSSLLSISVDNLGNAEVQHFDKVLLAPHLLQVNIFRFQI